MIYFFNSDFKFFDDASEFSVCSFYVVFIFSKNFMLIFLQFSISTGAVVTSSRHRHLVICTFTFYQKYATGTRISVCVIAVSKSHEFLLKLRRISSFFSTTTPTPSRRRVVFFSTTSDTTLDCSSDLLLSGFMF